MTIFSFWNLRNTHALLKLLYQLQKKNCDKCLKTKVLVKANHLFDKHAILAGAGGGVEGGLAAIFRFNPIKLDFAGLHKSVKHCSQGKGKHFRFTLRSPVLFDDFGVALRSIWH